jgi:AcrR family transcriptional regulator
MIEDKLLDVAIAQFGQFGLEGASTRAIARAAGTAMSSITYHYGGKEGLYLATADHIAAQMRERLHPIVAAAAAAGAIAPDDAIEAILRVLDAIAQIMLGPESEHWARFIVREQMQPTEAFERIYAGAMAPVMAGMARLIAAATGQTDPLETRLLALTMFGQALVFRAARATVMKAIERLDTATEAAIRLRIRSNIHAILIAARNEP